MDDNRWVNERLAKLEPARDWQPDTAAALGRFQQRKRAGQSLRRRLLWTAATAAAIFGGAMFMPVAGSCAPPPSVCTERLWQRVLRMPPAAGAVEPAQPIVVRSYKEFGSVSAKVGCEVYTDYQCPACATIYRDLVPMLMTDYVKTGKVKLLHRDFPLPAHAFARLAARYANAAGRLGYYETAVNQIFNTQAQWSVSGDVDAALAPVLPAGVMLKVRDLVEHDAKLEESVAADISAGRADQLRQTPSFVVVTKGKRVLLPGTPSFSLLKTYLDQMLAQ
jgi:protein-disulfide isomerase